MVKKLGVFEVPFSRLWPALDEAGCRDLFNRGRRGRESASVVAHCITVCEDWLEAHRPRFDRGKLRRMRRSIEDSVL